MSASTDSFALPPPPHASRLSKRKSAFPLRAPPADLMAFKPPLRVVTMPAAFPPPMSDLVNDRALGGKLGPRPIVDVTKPRTLDFQSLLIRHSDIPVPTLGSRRSVSASIGLGSPTTVIHSPTENGHSTNGHASSSAPRPRVARRRVVELHPDGSSAAMRSTRSASSSLPGRATPLAFESPVNANGPGIQVEPPTPISSPSRPDDIINGLRKRTGRTYFEDDVSDDGSRRLERSTSADPLQLTINGGAEVKRRRGGSAEPGSLPRSPLSKTFGFEDAAVVALGRPPNGSRRGTRGRSRGRGRPVGTRGRPINTPASIVSGAPLEQSLSNGGSMTSDDESAANGETTSRRRTVAVPVHLRDYDVRSTSQDP